MRSGLVRTPALSSVNLLAVESKEEINLWYASPSRLLHAQGKPHPDCRYHLLHEDKKQCPILSDSIRLTTHGYRQQDERVPFDVFFHHCLHGFYVTTIIATRNIRYDAYLTPPLDYDNVTKIYTELTR